MIRTLVIDDEPLARQLLISMLEEHPDIRVEGEADNGTDAIEAIRRLDPDLVFLDVQMPELDGFDVLAGMPKDRVPEVIFVTAFDHYALRAFEVHALDYLLKPFDEDRLGAALARARRHLARPDRVDDTHRILQLLQDLQRKGRYIERLVIRVGDRSILQPVGEIDWIEADGKHLRVHVGRTQHVIRETMTQVCELLDPAQFMRVSRSAIVNIDSIREIQPWFRGEHAVVLKDGTQVYTTKSYRDAVTKLLGSAGIARTERG
jgi:two-component system, LytTR family, response regulator